MTTVRESDTRHPVLLAARALSDAVAGAAPFDPIHMTPAEKAAALCALTRAEAQVAALRLRVMAAADDLAERDGARDVAAWLVTEDQVDYASMRADQELAIAVDRRWSVLGQALGTGSVSVAQARVIAHALDALPGSVDPETVADAEGRLVEYAADFRPTQLRRLGRRILDVVAPEIAEAEEARRLAAEESAARRAVSLTFRPMGDGTTRLTGLLPDAGAARLQTYLESFTAPRHSSSTHHSSSPGGLTEADRLPHHRKLGHAFLALLEHLDPRALPDHGGDATTVMVTLSLDGLRRDLATAGLLDGDLSCGDNLTAGEARRLACTARIIPAVLDGAGEVLDLGRAQRLFSPPQRKAMRIRDQRCRAEACTVPATWCEAHHRDPWSTGGRTDLADGVLLCHWHHHRIHDPAYESVLLGDGDYRIRRRT